MWYRVVKAAFGVAKQEKQSNDGSTVSVIAPENMSILNPGNISIINTNIDDEISEIQPKSDSLSPENLTTEEQLRMNFPDNETPIRNTLNQTDSDIHMFKGEGRYLALRNKGLFTEKSAPSSKTWV